MISPVGGGIVDLPPFFSLSAFDTVGSTNLEARKQADAGMPEGKIVWSRRQEQGVGRRGRNWSSPEGNLYCSLLLRPECDPLTGATLSFLIAVALHKAISSALPVGSDIKVKWPNDILINGKKSAGILLESKTRVDGTLDYVIVGTGVNIAAYPKDTDGLPATSIKAAGGNVTIELLLSRYAHHFLESYMIWKADGFAPIRAEWLIRAAGLGQKISVKLSDMPLEGVFSGLDETGALILTLDDGKTKRITAGEVFIVP
ncbi:MAG: biotin--[acetyl-CoA-carboxylase] ligase [Sneathiella sp.]|nr:MAG: biotin--[acetyl-CoA-carboxylase] ligase [Sneathiella sp.]